MRKLSYICGAHYISIIYLLSGNDNPYRNIDDCLAMGHARETWRIYTAEMRCVVSNPVREAFVIYSSYYAHYTPNQPSAGRSGRCSSQKSIPEPQVRPRQDGRMGQVPHLGLLPARLRSQAERRRQRQGSGHSADELHRPHQCPAGAQEGGHGRELTHRHGHRRDPVVFYFLETEKNARNEKKNYIK